MLARGMAAKCRAGHNGACGRGAAASPGALGAAALGPGSALGAQQHTVIVQCFGGQLHSTLPATTQPHSSCCCTDQELHDSIRSTNQINRLELHTEGLVIL